MNYSHSYHAGNFADVFKHSILISLIKSLLRKENAFCYLDTHAGSGVYDLLAESAQKSKEYDGGLSKLLHQKNPPELIKEYLNCLKGMNKHSTTATPSSLRYYPGSPAIARSFLRAKDRMILSELHPKEYILLKKHFSNDSQVSTHLSDGYQGLKAFLPPKERRGLILMDPPYEKPNELSHIVSQLPLALKRFATGIYAIWYPIKDRVPIEHFYRSLKEKIQQPMLITELSIYPETSPQHLNGCGMLIINPPWQIDIQINEYLPWLWSQLSVQGQGQHRLFSLTS